jgi:hypothetical protein
MRFLARSLLLAACLLWAAAPIAHASGPSTMSYQGVLTDGGGNLVPDGNYDLTFRIYDMSVGGAAKWTETHNNVPVEKGGFSVILGSATPINVPFNAQYYLGIQVGANPELAPRVVLAGSPGAMTLAMRGTAGNTTGEASWYPTASGFGDGGGYLHLFADSPFNSQSVLEPDFDGDGAWMQLTGTNNSTVYWDGNPGGSGGHFVISGTAATTVIRTEVTGTQAVQLPQDAVASNEILDEPGITSDHMGATNLPITSTSSGALTDIVSTTIDIPAPGYIVVEAATQFGIWDQGIVGYQISETSGGARLTDYYFYIGSTGVNAFSYSPGSARRVFYKAAAGSYAFYFQAYRTNVGPSGSVHYAWNPTITAQYFPTGYGAVNTIVSASEAASFEHATPVTASTNPLQPGSSDGMRVDLRELELRLRRQEAQAAETRLQLERARMKRQGDRRARATAAAAPARPEER